MRALVVRVGPAFCSPLMMASLRVNSGGCLAVGSYLSNRGLAVDLWDIPLKYGVPQFKKSYENRLRTIASALGEAHYDIVGISITSGTEYLNAMDLARTVKEEQDEALVLAGGYHASALGRKLFSDTENVDVVLSGEAEPLLDVLLKRLPRRDFSGIPNLIWRDKAGVVRENAIRPINADVNALPFYDVDLLEDPGAYTVGITMEGSRGCPHNCSFCPNACTQGVDWSATRQKSPRRFADELREAAGRLQARGCPPRFFMSDLTFGIMRNWTTSFLSELDSRRLEIEWTCETRVGCFPYDVLKAMSRTGCHWINYGIESGSPKMLELMSKTSNPEAYLKTALDSVADTVRAGMSAHATFIIGYPGETHQTLEETSSFVNKLIDVGEGKFLPWFFIFSPYPGTLAWKMMPEYEKRFGTKVIHGEWWKNRSYAGSWGENVTVIPSKHVTEEEIYRWKSKLSRLSGPPFTF